MPRKCHFSCQGAGSGWYWVGYILILNFLHNLNCFVVSTYFFYYRFTKRGTYVNTTFILLAATLIEASRGKLGHGGVEFYHPIFSSCKNDAYKNDVILGYHWSIKLYTDMQLVI